MTYRKLLEALTPEDIQFYLERSGWEKIDDENRKFILYKTAFDGTYVEILLPKSKSSIDFFRRTEEIIHTLSNLNNIEPTKTIQQIYAYDRDFINLRILNRNVARNTVPLFLANRVLVSLSKLLKFAAAQTEETRGYYLRATEKALAYTDGLRFGHTFEGSFGFTVESPLNVQSIGIPEIGISAPFERQVVDRVFEGLEIVEKATNSGSSSIIVDNIVNGFNANMCDAIVEISEEIEAVEVAYNFAWSPIVPVSSPIKAAKIFVLTSGTYRILEDAARQLKDSIDELDTTIVGSVTILKAPPGFLVHEESVRTVTITGKTENGTGLQVNITTNLKTDDYQLACDAHRDGKYVKLEGHIFRGATRRWEIRDYINFSIIND
jgi:hypothetical protein